MLNERQIELLPERIYQRLNNINTEYLESIGKVIKEIGELRPSDVHKLRGMYMYGSNVQIIADKLAKASEKNIAEIYDIFDIVAKENYDCAKPFYKAQNKAFIPYEENRQLQLYVKSLAKQTVDEYVNLTQHTAFAVFDKGNSIAPLFESNKNKIATSLSDTYTKVIDYAVTKVQTGVADYNSAIRDVIKSMASSGIRTVDYATGYSRRLDTTVRQNILWGIKQCNQNTADMIGEEFGADGYEISYHSNPRPSHADMGGKQYAKGKGATINGVYYPPFSDVEHLLEEYNCLHFKFSILLGVSVPAYTDDELEQLKAEDAKTFEFEGKKYNKYEASQIQRQLETKIRHQKDIAVIAKSAGNGELRREAQEKINLLTNKYAKLSKTSGLPTKAERMNVKGFRSVKVKTVDKSDESDIIKNKNFAVASSRYLNKLDVLYENSKNIVPKPNFEDIVCHGDSIGLIYRNPDGKETSVSAKEFCEILLNDPNYKGGNIRLISCETGYGEHSVAQYIANTLKVEVLAPTEKVFVDENGNMYVTNSRRKAKQRINTGIWKLFKPRGR